MTRITIPWKSWVLVCDGAKALLFQNAGDNEALNLKVAEVRFEPHEPTRKIGTERPGRVHESLGNARSSVEGTDWHAVAEAEFLHRIADEIDQVVHKQGVKHLVLVAPPKALGMLRQRLTPAVRAVLKAEIAKDLARLSTSEIEGHLSAMCQVP